MLSLCPPQLVEVKSVPRLLLQFLHNLTTASIMSSTQPTISSYFSPPKPRASDQIDLTVSSDDAEEHEDSPPRKKAKLCSRDPVPVLKPKGKAAVENSTSRRKTKPAIAKVEVEELSGDDSDFQFKALTAMFKQKNDTTRREGKVPAKQKVQEEVGPSGQTYTPLEKQVSVPPSSGDVLLRLG